MPLRLGTFNIWGLPEAFAADVSPRMRGLASRLRGLDLDVLLIQEAWTEEVRDTLRRAALDSGFEVAGDHKTSGGLMSLSRIPIRSSRFGAFRFRGDPERLSKGEFLGRKGFQTFTVESEEGPLVVVNTHLHARYRRLRPQLNSAVRLVQLLQLVGELNDLDGTVVVGGDFNCTRADLEYKSFAHLTRSTELADGQLHPTLSRTNYYKRHRTGADKRVDYLFVRPGPDVEFRSVEAGTLFAEPEPIRGRDRSLSDHYGFRASLELRRSTPGSPTNWHSYFDPETIELSRNLLRIGRKEADRREREHSRTSGGWALAAGFAALIRRNPTLDRRRFLRSSAGALAALALMPAFGYSALARLDSDYKRDAFDDAYEILAELEARGGGGHA